MTIYNIVEEPLKKIILYNNKLGVRSFVIIHDTIVGINGGGIRLNKDVTEEEIGILAHAMNLKTTFYEIPVGGAKCGIRLDAANRSKKEILKWLGEALASEIRTLEYIPATDMNTDENDIKMVNGDGTVNSPLHRRAGNEVNLTCYGIMSAIESYTDFYGSEDLKESVLIDGFGKMGESIAMLLHNNGYRVVGISTVHGSIYDENGIDIPSLSRLKEQYNDSFIIHTNYQIHPPSDLYAMKGKLIIPGTGVHMVNAENVKTIRAGVAIPVANVPFTYDAVKIYHLTGSTYIPDFVVNAGGLLYEVLARTAIDKGKWKTIITDMIYSRTYDLLKRSRTGNKLPIEIAINDAIKNRKRLKSLFERDKTIEHFIAYISDLFSQ
ncbi:MAG: hypothetical protein M1481_02780 [Candidatus Thermoplasmatota archaeon]|jgi:glutamate dehydrogenase/leucine dehydrogenase|nr:hypothetical protein [Candidatus Thermoplasmatota archaeon]MCL5963158.1 hypothetical protein [Candidatus Thermoplasmatota archaeon]